MMIALLWLIPQEIWLVSPVCKLTKLAQTLAGNWFSSLEVAHLSWPEQKGLWKGAQLTILADQGSVVI